MNGIKVKRISRLAGVLCCVAMVAAVPWCRARAAAVQTLNMTGQESARIDLDGDSLADNVAVSQRSGKAWLDVTYGDGSTVSCAVGPAQAEVIKISSVDLTGEGRPDIVVLSRNASEYYLSAISVGGGEYSLLPVPNPESDQGYRMVAAFSRNYVLEITNASGAFMVTVKLPEETFRSLYRTDGTAPETLRAQVSSFQDFAIVPSGSGYAVELWQYVRTSAVSVPIGAVVSTITWRDGRVKLVNQRYEPQ